MNKMSDSDVLILGGIVGVVGVAAYTSYRREKEIEEKVEEIIEVIIGDPIDYYRDYQRDHGFTPKVEESDPIDYYRDYQRDHGFTPKVEESDPIDYYRDYQRDHGFTPIPPLFGPENKPLLGPEYRGPIFEWDSPTPRSSIGRRQRSRYIPPEIPEPYIHRLRIEKGRRLPEIDDPYIERPLIGEDEEAKEERRRRYWEWKRRQREKTTRRRWRIRGVIESTYYGVGALIYGVLTTLDYLLEDFFVREVTTIQKTYSYLMDRLRDLIREEEMVVKRKVEIVNETPPKLRPSLLDNDGLDIEVYI